MIRKLFTVALLGMISAPALLAVGCASENQGDRPYGLTGTDGDRNVNTPGTFEEKQRYSDQKGRYHPEWVDQGGH
jgi:hypothetical protein